MSLKSLARAVDVTVPVFLVTYLGVTAALFRDGSVVAEGGASLTPLARWLCVGWVPCALLALGAYALRLRSGGLDRWSTRARRTYPVVFLVSLPLWLWATESLVHRWHGEGVACEGRIPCALAKPTGTDSSFPTSSRPAATRPAPGTDSNLPSSSAPGTASRPSAAPAPPPAQAGRLAGGVPSPPFGQAAPSLESGSASGDSSGGPAGSTTRSDGLPGAPAPWPNAPGELVSAPHLPLGGAAGGAALPDASAHSQSGWPGLPMEGAAGAPASSPGSPDAHAASADPPQTPLAAAVPTAAATGAASLDPSSGAAPQHVDGSQLHPNGRPRCRGRLRVDPETGERHRHGPWTEWAPDGQKLAEGSYLDGKREGPWREWYADGTPRLAATYREGVPMADLVEWHPNGTLARHRNELRTEDGRVLWIEDRFDPEGRRRGRSQYRDGLLHGPSREWDETGRLRQEGSWASGERHGIWLHRDAEGEVERHEIWEQGRLRGAPPASR